MTKHSPIQVLIQEGEGQKIEFKERHSHLAPELVAFANSTGGRILLGVNDVGTVIKIPVTNTLKSQITDIARNCDPAIKIKIREHPEGVLEIEAPEGPDKPYKCSEGFFVRIGPNTQKMTRNEIIELIRHGGKIRFDEMINEAFEYPDDFGVDNPGGMLRGMTPEELGKRAIRRNRLLADLMQRAGYIENAGTGISRIKDSMKNNNNPPPQFLITNFFIIRLKIRPKNLTEDKLTERQTILYSYVSQKGSVSKTECQKILDVSSDTTLNELKTLIRKGLVNTSGKGKKTRYFVA